VKQHKKLLAGVAAAITIVTLSEASAFAESRPQRGTRSDGGAISRGRDSASRAPQRGDSSVSRGDARRDSRGGNDARRDGGAIRRGDDSSRQGRNEGYRRGGDDSSRRGSVDARGGVDTRGSQLERDRQRRSNDRYSREGRDRDRTYGQRNESSQHGRYNRGQQYSHRGRISRMHRYGDGYRVWVVGAPYPYYIPSHYYHRDRFRVGLWITLGGYYNPLGYYDYYDGYSYDRNYAYSRGELRGIVESVDSRRSSFVLRNEETGNYVTVVPRGRRVYVRPGEYVEVDGTWSRTGLFTAYDIDWLDRDRYADRDDWDDRY
jgi:hypothetical protein